jgi:hypothetical protein
MKILADKYPDYKRVIPDDWSIKVAVSSSTDFVALIDSIADHLSSRHPVPEEEE